MKAKSPFATDHAHSVPVPAEEIFAHLVQQHGLIPSSRATNEIMQRTHNEEHPA